MYGSGSNPLGALGGPSPGVLDVSYSGGPLCGQGLITDLTGVKDAFTCMTRFTCNNQQITTADFSGMINLEILELNSNEFLTSINVTGCEALTTVVAYGGRSHVCSTASTCGNTGNVSGNPGNASSDCTDQYGGCDCDTDCKDYRKLTSFTAPDSPDLSVVALPGQVLSSIDVSANTNLTVFEVGQLTGISSLDLTTNTKLTDIVITADSSFNTLTLSSSLDLT